MKLDYASKALGGVSESVEEVSRKLAFTCAPDINGVYKRLEKETCAGCSLHLYCWGQRYTRTIDAFNSLTPALRRDGRVTRQDLPDHVSSHCARVTELHGNITTTYAEVPVRAATQRRLAQISCTIAANIVSGRRTQSPVALQHRLSLRH